MIDVKELRIGNLVLAEGNYVLVKTIHAEYINEAENADRYDPWSGYFISELQPILLTPDILIRCGFKRYDIGETEDENDWILPVDHDDENNYLPKFKLSYEMDYQINFGKSINVKWLHQLQNLYFALTEEELKVNLNHTAPSQPH